MIKQVSFLAAGLVLFVACAALERPAGTSVPAEAADISIPRPLSPEMSFDALRVASCLVGERPQRAQPITIQAEPVELGAPDKVAAALTGLTYVGGWALASGDPGFGGLSAVDVLPNGDLLTVSDSGAFVWISLKEGAEFEPEPEGSIAYMRGLDGQHLQGKRNTDAEGLALKDGLALVSFEREHRVLAFDLESCGAAARGVLVHDLTPLVAAADFNISENNGAEALALAGHDQLLVGIEERGQCGAPLSVGGIGSEPRIEAYIDNGPRQSLTGADVLAGKSTGDPDQMLYTVHRGYDPIRGNTIRIQETAMDWEAHATDVDRYEIGNSRVLAELNPPLTVDNFEGIAATRLTGGTVRLYIISDDNFSGRQRTLLMAFDVIPERAE